MKPKKGGADQAPPALVAQITGMGFTNEQAAWSLGKCDNNVPRAIDYLFNHAGEMEADKLAGAKSGDLVKEEESYSAVKGLSAYTLSSIIVHLGKSADCGHYVCYTKKDGKWIYYNDRKCCVSEDPSIEKGFLFLMTRVEGKLED